MITFPVGSARQIITEISQKKKVLDEDTSPLIDGSLPEPGPYDSSEDTVTSATRPSNGFREQQFFFTTTLLHQPVRVLELGTGVGISSAYIASAIKATGVRGAVSTIDASPYKIKLAKRLHDDLQLDNIEYVVGRFADVLPDVLPDLGGVDMALVDGAHDPKSMWSFYDAIIEAAVSGALLLFTGIAGSEQLSRTWHRMRTDPRTYASSELGGIGLIYKAS
jgi:predicted O-methyltransferase YrrM